MKRILLLLATAIIITMLTPNRALIDLEVHKGEMWNEESKIAPFDVPIIKSTSAIEKEKQEIIQNFEPIFRIDTINSNRRIKSLLAALQSDQTETDSVSKMLHHVYATGVIPPSEYAKYENKLVRICSSRNDITTMPTKELFTPEMVVKMLRMQNVKLLQLQEYIQPNLSYDEKLNKDIRRDELKNISTTRTMVRAGEIIINKGQVVDEYVLQVMSSYRLAYEQQVGRTSALYIVMGARFLLIFILLIINYLFFTTFAVRYFNNELRPWIFIMLLYVLMALFVSIAGHLDGVSPYIIPLPIVAIYLMTYFNMRVAIFGNISVAIIAALFVRIPFDYFLINFMAGMVAIFMMRHHYHRNSLFKAIGVIYATQIIVYIGVSLLRESDFADIAYINVLWLLFNVFLILGLYQAIYLIERIFGFVSDITLLELCDTNQPLLMQLAEKAPGTFQHSVQVANLAEAAAKEIGANPLLARTGAMYHDIGKMENPFHFTENQIGEFNPHLSMTPIESAAMIRKHVTDGVVTAIKNRLPRQVIDFIEAHHGTSKIYYFYASQIEKFGAVEDESLFTYPGPRPVCKEVSICMMADAIEAASRSLPSYDKELLEALVDKIINIQISEGQLSDSELSFCEVEQIKTLIKTKLNTIYHVRISYPERK